MCRRRKKILVAAPQYAQQSDKEVDDIEINILRAVHGVVQRLGVGLRFGHVVADIAGEEEDEEPVEQLAAVAEEEGGHDLGHDADDEGDDEEDEGDGDEDEEDPCLRSLLSAGEEISMLRQIAGALLLDNLMGRLRD